MKFALLISNHYRNNGLLKSTNLIRNLQTLQNIRVKTFLPVTSKSCQLRQTSHYQVALWPQVFIGKWTNVQYLKPCLVHSLPYNKIVNVSSSLHTSSMLLKSLKSVSKRKKQEAALDEDTEDEDDIELTDESDVSEDELSDVENEDSDKDQPKDYKDVHHNLTSLRIDAVLSKGLTVSRKKVEDSFFNTNLRLNGKVLTKKGKKVNKGDTVDIIKGPAPPSKDGTDKEEENILLMRVVVKDVLPDKTSKDRVRVVLRRWKNLKLPKSEVIT